jgi:ATP phosphoribosyltransferase regulatory subunit
VEILAKWNIYTPEGVRDILFDECFAKRNLESRLRNLFRSIGFFEIETPTLEFYDAFSPDSGFISQEDMFKFFDQQGRILVLRPDATIPVARVAATKYADGGYPLKFSYIVNTYRYNELGGGKQKEFTVAGAEIIGAGGPEADAEVMATAVNALRELGLESFQIDMGQMEFFRGLMEETGLPEDEIERLGKLIDKKDSIGLKDSLDAYGIRKDLLDLILGLPSYFGTLDVLDRVEAVTRNGRSLKALDNLRQVYSIMQDYGFEKYVSIDLAMVPDLYFYTGIIFKGYTYDVGFPILRGGRYDRLVSKFGKDMAATGFSLGLNMAMMAMERQGISTERPRVDAVICYDSGMRACAARICDELRKQGLVVEMSLVGNNPDEVRKYAEMKGIGGFMKITQDDSVEVYDLVNGTAEKKNLDELRAGVPSMTEKQEGVR